MRDHAVVRSVNEPITSRQSFTPRSINEPTPIPSPNLPAPTITSIEPPEAAIGAETFTLVIHGTTFIPGVTVINFAGYDEPSTVAGSTVSTIVDMDYWHGPDNIPVFLHNGEKVSNEVIFTFLPPEMIEGTRRETGAVADNGFNVDYRDPDELEEELELAREEGDYAAVGVKKTTVKVKKK
jgi:hypothetical protein